MGKGIQTERFP